LTPEQFKKEIKVKPKALYLLKGNDPFHIEDCVQAAREILDETALAFNFHSFRLGEDPSPMIVSEASSSSFFPSPRVVVVKVPEFYSFSAEDSETFTAWIKNPAQDSTIILLYEKPDERTKFMKAVKESKGVVECLMPEKKGLPTWLTLAFQKQGMKINSEAVRVMLDRAGDNPYVLIKEIEKLSLYPGPLAPITTKVILELVSLAPTAIIYELGEPVGEKNLQKAIPILMDLLESTEPFALIYSLGTHLKRLFSIKLKLLEFEEQGKPQSDVARALGLHPFYYEKLRDQARRWSLEELQVALERIENASRVIVTTSIPTAIVLEELVVALITGIKGKSYEI
jgi:DNA polymerase-3 subunit delta